MKTLISAIGITALSLSLGWQVQAAAEAIPTIDDETIVVDETADSELMVDFVYDDDASGYVEEDEGASEANSDEEVVDPYMDNYDESEGDTGECTEDCEDDGYTGDDD